MADCAICKRRTAGDTIVFGSENWIVRHSEETNIPGYLLIESRRHFLDLSEATERETADYGSILSATMKAIRDSVECERVYTFSLAEAVPHYHLHVIPRRADFPRAYRARGIMQYPLTPSLDVSLREIICDRLRAAFRTTSICR